MCFVAAILTLTDKMLLRVVKSLDEDDAFSLGLELNLDLQQITDLREEYPDERDAVLLYVLHVSVML